VQKNIEKFNIKFTENIVCLKLAPLISS